MAYLTLEQLQKTYPDGTRAVKGVDLAIDAGEFIVLLGPSGCGKTTTLRMLAGLEMPTAGGILLDGQDITGLRPGQRDVGFVFQFYALYPHLTVAGNIGFPLENAGMGKKECRGRVEAKASRMGLTSLLGLHPRQLSGGDQQRVALARAMVRQPRLYLMDEPLGTLDADLRLSLREYIREQQAETGVTTIYVTHDQEEAMALADRMVVMRAGEICQVGSPEEVYENPADLFVAHFVGSPGMNLFEGVATRDGASRYVTDREAAARFPLPAHRYGDLAPGPVTWGIRPEYLTVADDGPLTGNVTLVEHLGAYTYLYADTSFGRIVIHATREAHFAPGTQVGIRMDADYLRLFDAITGKAILPV